MKGMEIMIQKRTWKEFKDNGSLWQINMILHTFGWAIVIKYDDKRENIVDLRKDMELSICSYGHSRSIRNY